MTLNGKSLTDLTDLQRHNLEASITPQGPFSGEQRQFLSAHLLKVTTGQLDALNEAAGCLCTVFARKAKDGKLYLSSDILTDAINGRRLSALLPILEQLTFTSSSKVKFPQPAIEE